ncbi:hypothetical protein A3K79_04215 [Candidatus Bathyarchaeota archaeon RBG_13_46_16b]|nr:MAG: hypothetical protein A3K79_04215 [Candidatus Bathyarchaeota archaeon RBG_13_46_16b]
MKPLEKVYWLRLLLGIIAALVCAGYVVVTHEIPPALDKFQMNTFFNSASIAIVIYLMSYYAVKFKFQSVVQKPQKLATTGIGVYLLSWIVVWALLYTIIVGRLSPLPL